MAQGEKFDPQGKYVREWLPQLADVADNMVHQPWELGMLNPYVAPIVDHAVEREESLARYKAVSGK